MYYSREKNKTSKSIPQEYAIQKITDYFEVLHDNFSVGEETFEINVSSDEGDCILFIITCLFSFNDWYKPGKDSEEGEVQSVHLETLSTLFTWYWVMAVMTSFT